MIIQRGEITVTREGDAEPHVKIENFHFVGVNMHSAAKLAIVGLIDDLHNLIARLNEDNEPVTMIVGDRQ